MDSVLWGFIGTLCALAVTKTIEAMVSRAIDDAHARQDVAIEVLSMISAAEDVLQTIVRPMSLENREQLAQSPSAWTMSEPIRDLASLLEQLKDPKQKRLLTLFLERDAMFRLKNAEHEQAYFWLLDEDSVDWESLRSKERQETIKIARKWMGSHTYDLLRFGWELIEQVVEREGVLHVLIRQSDVQEFARKQYGWDRDEIRKRCLYYGLNVAPGPFDKSAAYVEHEWVGDAALQAKARGGVLCGEFLSRGRREPIVVAPFQPFSLCAGSIIRPYIYFGPGDEARSDVEISISIENQQRALVFPPGHPRFENAELRLRR